MGSHQGGQVDTGRQQLLVNSHHIVVGTGLVGAVFTNGNIQEVVVVAVDMGLPVGNFAVFVGADVAVSEEIHEHAVTLAVSAEVGLPGDTFHGGEALEIHRGPVAELYGIGQGFHHGGVSHRDGIGFQINGAISKVRGPIISLGCVLSGIIGGSVLNSLLVVGGIITHGNFAVVFNALQIS